MSTPQHMEVGAVTTCTGNDAIRARQQGTHRPPWRQSLVDAESGLRQGLRTDGTFTIYFFAFSVVVAGGFVVGLALWEWALIVLALGAVLATQLLHQMLLSLMRLLKENNSRSVETPIQFGVAAVTVTNLGAFGCIALVLLPRLMTALN